MEAVILCGGKGLRMRPLTLETPKSMLKIEDKAILDFVLMNLKKNKVKKTILTVGYLKEKIIAYLPEMKKYGAGIEFLEEEEEQNTAGSILPLKDEIKEDFIVMMGDQITNIDLHKMMEFHKKEKAIATVALKKKEYPLEYGIVEVKGNRVIELNEKPVLEKYINTAIYIFSPKIFDFIEPNDDFAKNVFPRLLKEKQKVSAYFMEEKWVDIGRIKDYEDLKKHPERIGFIKT